MGDDPHFLTLNILSAFIPKCSMSFAKHLLRVCQNSVATIRALTGDKGVHHAETVLGQCKAL
jgi:hypothetical protein